MDAELVEVDAWTTRPGGMFDDEKKVDAHRLAPSPHSGLSNNVQVDAWPTPDKIAKREKAASQKQKHGREGTGGREENLVNGIEAGSKRSRASVKKPQDSLARGDPLSVSETPRELTFFRAFTACSELLDQLCDTIQARKLLAQREVTAVQMFSEATNRLEQLARERREIEFALENAAACLSLQMEADTFQPNLILYGLAKKNNAPMDSQLEQWFLDSERLVRERNDLRNEKLTTLLEKLARAREQVDEWRLVLEEVQSKLQLLKLTERSQNRALQSAKKRLSDLRAEYASTADSRDALLAGSELEFEGLGV